MNLFNTAERIASIDRSQLVLDAGRCLHSLDRAAVCERCFQICPAEAITPGKPPALDTGRCESCYACLPVCPVGAYSADDAVRSLLSAAAHVEDKIVELVCAKNPQPGTGVSDQGAVIRLKGCLAGLGAGTYLALAALGLERVIARTEACAECAWAGLRPQIEEQVALAAQFLSGWDKKEALALSSPSQGLVERVSWAAENPPLSRRDLFRLAARQGQMALARAMENGERLSGRRPGRDRLRLLGAVAHLGSPQVELEADLRRFDFALVAISEACNACGACGRACPTEALKFEKDQNEAVFALTFSARNCIGCDLCAHVCQPAAVSVDHAPSFTQVFSQEPTTLREGELVKCARCGSLIAKRDGARLCDLCEFRRQNPFGSVMPPGFEGGPPKTPETRL